MQFRVILRSSRSLRSFLLSVWRHGTALRDRFLVCFRSPHLCPGRGASASPGRTSPRAFSAGFILHTLASMPGLARSLIRTSWNCSVTRTR